MPYHNGNIANKQTIGGIRMLGENVKAINEPH